MKLFLFGLPFSFSLPERKPGRGDGDAAVAKTAISNTLEMAKAVLNGSGAHGFTVNDGVNYGCAGRGSYSAFTGSIGKPVDDTDKAFNTWKKCVKCAVGDLNGVQAYSYSQVDDSCAGSSSESRPVCECDRILINFLYNATNEYSDYKKSKCSPGKNIFHKYSEHSS